MFRTYTWAVVPVGWYSYEIIGRDKPFPPIFFTAMSFQNHVQTAPKANNWLSHSLLVILLVFSVLLFHILLMSLYRNWIKPRDRPLLKLPRNSASSECGMDWYLVLSWLVLWLHCNGSSTMEWKSLSVFHDHHHQRCQNLLNKSLLPRTSKIIHDI